MKKFDGFYLLANKRVCSPLFLRSKLGEAFEDLLIECLIAQSYTEAIIVPLKGTDQDMEDYYFKNFRG